MSLAPDPDPFDLDALSDLIAVGPGDDDGGADEAVGSPATSRPAARVGDRVPTRGSGGGGLIVRVLRPWFEPRPGELKGAVILLSVALAASLALWFDATRRPSTPEAAFAVPMLADTTAGEWSDVLGPDALGAAEGSGSLLAGDASVTVARDPLAVAPDGGLVVHVSGAVLSSGVVRLAPGARVGDAIAAAGGPMPDAWTDRLNLARVVIDGEQIHVPRVGEDAPPPAAAASSGVLSDGRVDINRASATELATLPGIGPARAQAIIAERTARPFRVPGDLRRVSGIGEATFQRLAPLIVVS